MSVNTNRSKNISKSKYSLSESDFSNKFNIILPEENQVLIFKNGKWTNWENKDIKVNLNSVSIGCFSGETNQGISSVSIGTNSGRENQGNSSVAIGFQAANTSQKPNSVAIGSKSGLLNQGINCVSIGNLAGKVSQGDYSIAIGDEAGKNVCKSGSIVLGKADAPAINSLVINTDPSSTFVPKTETGVYLNGCMNSTPTADGFYQVWFNPETKQLMYGSSAVL